MLIVFLFAAAAAWLFNDARLARNLEATAKATAQADANLRATAEAIAVEKAAAAATAQVEAEAARDEASVQADRASSQAAFAGMQEQVAKQQQRIALANQLAASALTKLKLEGNPGLALLLATEAISIPWHADAIRTSAAEEALRDALMVVAADPISLSLPNAPLQSIGFHADGTNSTLWLAGESLSRVESVCADQPARRVGASHTSR